MTQRALPELCYAINLAEQGVARLIIIKRGETGYFPTEGYGARSEELVDMFNARMGVTPAERRAMELGSMRGFGIPGADPAKHEADVKPARETGEDLDAYLARVIAHTLAEFKANSPAVKVQA